MPKRTTKTTDETPKPKPPGRIRVPLASLQLPDDVTVQEITFDPEKNQIVLTRGEPGDIGVSVHNTYDRKGRLAVYHVFNRL